jgi:hypothetical protein
VADVFYVGTFVEFTLHDMRGLDMAIETGNNQSATSSNKFLFIMIGCIAIAISIGFAATIIVNENSRAAAERRTDEELRRGAFNRCVDQAERAHDETWVATCRRQIIPRDDCALPSDVANRLDGLLREQKEECFRKDQAGLLR